MMSEKVRISANRKATAAALLAAGELVQDVAAQCRIDPRTLLRWRNEPDFAKLVADLRTTMLDSMVGKLASAGPKAAKKLVELIDHADPAIAGKNAERVIDRKIRIRETIDLEQRVAALEAKK